jgi:hypothetical protein
LAAGAISAIFLDDLQKIVEHVVRVQTVLNAMRAVVGSLVVLVYDAQHFKPRRNNPPLQIQIGHVRPTGVGLRALRSFQVPKEHQVAFDAKVVRALAFAPKVFFFFRGLQS